MCDLLTLDVWKNFEGFSIQLKVRKCGEKLSDWGKKLMGNFGSRIKRCKAEMGRLRNKRDLQSQEHYKAAKKELTLILNQRKFF